jgi:hypothetical protein
VVGADQDGHKIYTFPPLPEIFEHSPNAFIVSSHPTPSPVVVDDGWKKASMGNKNWVEEVSTLTRAEILAAELPNGPKSIR